MLILLLQGIAFFVAKKIKLFNKLIKFSASSLNNKLDIYYLIELICNLLFHVVYSI